MKRALIIRHAHRAKMPSELGQHMQGFQENLVPITEAGEKLHRLLEIYYYHNMILSHIHLFYVVIKQQTQSITPVH